jgi:hypothetical protein
VDRAEQVAEHRPKRARRQFRGELIKRTRALLGGLAQPFGVTINAVKSEGSMSFITEGVIEKCNEEIEWAEACLAEMKSGAKYTEEDKVYLPCWIKAHKQILTLIAEQSHEPELERRAWKIVLNPTRIAARLSSPVMRNVMPHLLGQEEIMNLTPEQAFLFSKIEDGICPDCNERLTDDTGYCADCHTIPALNPEYQRYMKFLNDQKYKVTDGRPKPRRLRLSLAVFESSQFIENISWCFSLVN